MTVAKPTPARPARRGRPPRHERDARLGARRETLLEAAVAAVAADGAATTMTRMAAEAGVTKPVLYRYFGDRAGLYQAIGARFSAGLVGELRPALAGGDPPRRLLEAAVDAYLAYVDRHRQLYAFLTLRLPADTRDGQELLSGFVHQLAAEISTVMHEQLEAAGLDPEAAELLGFGITGMVQVAGERWLERPTMPRERAVAYLASMLWRGLAGIDAVAPRATGA